MTSINVPARHRQPLRDLWSLSDEELQSLITSLEEDGGERSVRDAVSKYVSDGEGAYDALLAVTASRLAYGWTTEAMSEQVSASIGQPTTPDGIQSLLKSPTLLRLAKRVDLAAAFERRLSTFRVFTDLRPMFEEDPTVSVKDILLVQTAQLSFVEDGRLKEIYLSLGREELLNIRDQVARALHKMTTAERLATEAGLHVMEEQ